MMDWSSWCAIVLLGGTGPAISRVDAIADLWAERDGNSLRLELRSTDDRPLHWSEASVLSLFLRSSGVRRNVLEFSSTPEVLEWRESWDASSPVLVGCEFPEVLDADRRRRLRGSAAVLVRGAEGHADTALGKCGQTGEIRLLIDPSRLATGSVLPFCAYVEGVGVAALVTASWSAADSARIEGVQQCDTQSSGHGRMLLDKPGRWTLRFTHVAELEDDEQADECRTSASLTFCNDPEVGR